MSDLKAEEYKNFEEIKKVREDGTEYWNARELSDVLQYKKWQNFSKVIDRAKLACKNSGRNIDYDFTEVSKIVEAGATQKKNLKRIKYIVVARQRAHIMKLEQRSEKQLKILEEQCQKIYQHQKKVLKKLQKNS